MIEPPVAKAIRNQGEFDHAARIDDPGADTCFCGARVLREGGNLADAMVAVQAVLGLVEPQSSGLGGGAFLVWHDAGTGEVTTLDGRETAPLTATPPLFRADDGAPLRFRDAVAGGLAVGTPGKPALMEDAHRRWGRANWAGLFEDAIAIAEEGFAVSPRLAGQIAADADRLTRFDATAAYFHPDGEALGAGDIRTNPDCAETLRALARNGASAVNISLGEEHRLRHRPWLSARDMIAVVDALPESANSGDIHARRC